MKRSEADQIRFEIGKHLVSIRLEMRNMNLALLAAVRAQKAVQTHFNRIQHIVVESEDEDDNS